MTLFPRRSGSINNICLHRNFDATSIKSVPVPTQTPSVGEILGRFNTEIKTAPYFIATAPEGLSLSWHSSSEITVKSGRSVTTIGAYWQAYLPTDVTKSISSTWTYGGAGGRFSGVTLEAGTYHVFLIYDLSTGLVDVGIDNSIVAANRPSGWFARRLGSIVYKDGVILKFFQNGFLFEYDVPQRDIIDGAIADTPTLYALTLPTGLAVIAKIILSAGVPLIDLGAKAITISMQSPLSTMLPPQSTIQLSTGFQGMAGGVSVVHTLSFNNSLTVNSSTSEYKIPTNTSAQIQMQRIGTYNWTLATTSVQTLGWEDFNLYKGG